MMEELFNQIEDAIESVTRKFYGVAVGRVINMLDPMMLGRVQVQLPFIDSLDLSPWARVAVPMAGFGHGYYFIPNLMDEVLVAFEHGDINSPYIIGSLWNAIAPPPLPSPVPQIRTIRTLVGNQIVFSEAPPTVTIQSGPTPPEAVPMPPTPAGPPTIVLSPIGIQIIFGLSRIDISPAGITITGTPSISLNAAGSIDITAPTVSINGAAATTLTSGGTCSVSAPVVMIN